ncbi:MAG: hypothetical protein GY753_12505 [Gammaproteobacteria bacterium]|nr:hypothetical protein [Gammaproteobacteria bacterium]
MKREQNTIRALTVALCLGLSLPTMADQTITYTYNPLGLVETIDGPRVDVNDITRFDYDAQGNRTHITNALGHITQISAHDASGRPLTLIDPNGVTTQLTYDARGRLLTRTTDGHITTLTYDGVGNVINITQADGSQTHYEYDPANRLTAISDGLGNRIVYTLDNAGNRIQEQVLDPANNLKRTHSRVYDELSRMIQRIGADSQTSSYSYDPDGNLTQSIDANSNPTTQAFDALNRLAQSTDAHSGITQYGYDTRDNLTSVTDPEGLATNYNYDALDNLLSQDSPDTGITTYTYDEAGNRLTKSDARGITATYTYDALNRVTTLVFPNSNLNITYAYDQGTNGKGRLTRMDDGAGESHYSYDTHGNLLTHSRIQGDVTTVTQYSYDSANRINSITYPSGRVVAYVRDSEGQIIQVNSTEPGEATQILVENITYAPFGGAVSWTYGNGLTANINLDQDYQISQIAEDGVLDRDYTYDPAGNITNILDLDLSNNSQDLIYDAQHRLISAAGGYGDLGYSYDGVGNRTQLTEGTAQSDYTYSPTSHQLQTITGTTTDTRTYDAMGNTLTSNGRTFIYNDTGRLSQAMAGFVTAAYAYNGSGERVIKSVNGLDTHYVYNQSGQLIAELNDSGQTTREYIYLNGQPMVLTSASSGGQPEPEALNLNQHPVLSYAYHQDVSGVSTVSGDGASLTITGNSWKKINFGYQLTQSTVLEFDFESTAEGEVHGIGFDTHNSNNANRTFRLYGTQNWGINAFTTYAGNGVVHYKIPVGEYYTGQVQYLFFVNDHDVSNPTAESRFSNLQIYEDEVQTPNTPTSGLYYYHNDHLGTPQALTDESQAVVWKGDYQPFGELQTSIYTVENPLRFPGQYYDGETGLYYNYFRTYDPATGRYLESDPIGLEGGLNTYAYVGGNPLIRIDPKGLDWVWEWADKAEEASEKSGLPGQRNGPQDALRHCIWTCMMSVDLGPRVSRATASTKEAFDFGQTTYERDMDQWNNRVGLCMAHGTDKPEDCIPKCLSAINNDLLTTGVPEGKY